MRPCAPFLFLALLASHSSGQSLLPAGPGLINFSEGDVTMNGQPLERKPGSRITLADGSLLETRAGRAEVLLAPGAWFRVGSDSVVRMLAGSAADTRIEVVRGSAIFDGSRAPAIGPVTIVVGNSSVQLITRGEFRIDAQPARVSVHSGTAQVRTSAPAGDKTVAVGASQVLSLADAPIVSRLAAESDSLLDIWSAKRRTLIDLNLADAPPIDARYPGPQRIYSSVPVYLSPVAPSFIAGGSVFDNTWYGYPQSGIQSHDLYAQYPQRIGLPRFQPGFLNGQHPQGFFLPPPGAPGFSPYGIAPLPFHPFNPGIPVGAPHAGPNGIGRH